MTKINKHSIKTITALNSIGLSVANPVCLGWEVKQISTHKKYRRHYHLLLLQLLSRRVADTERGGTSSGSLYLPRLHSDNNHAV